MSAGLHLTVQEFEQMVKCGAFDHLNRSVELIHGELREMNPAGPLHDDLVMYLTNWSAAVLLNEPISITSQTGLDLGELSSRPEPDLLWVRQARYRDRHPNASDVKLAIEVSDSSLQNDLNEKSALYAQAGIVEYWIVDAMAAKVHVHRSPGSGQYTDQTIVNTDKEVRPLILPRATLVVADLFAAD